VSLFRLVRLWWLESLGPEARTAALTFGSVKIDHLCNYITILTFAAQVRSLGRKLTKKREGIRIEKKALGYWVHMIG
jgi:hypothetical protein